MTDALAQRPSLEEDAALQRLWLATQKRAWRSLAIVAADEGVPTLGVATRLAEIGWWFRGQPTSVLDLREVGLRLVEYHVREMLAQLEQGDSVIVALRSIDENPTAAVIARATDAAILCVRLGSTKLRAAEHALTEIGRDKFIGSVLVAEERA